MGKRKLYPTLSTKKSGEEVKLMMDFISLCDGKNSLLQIAESLNVPIWNLYDLVKKLENQDLISANE
jgi:aminopeptidase-like protein